MRIEEELKTKGFGSENQKAQLNILFTAGWVRCGISASLKLYGVTPEQYNVLRISRYFSAYQNFMKAEYF